MNEILIIGTEPPCPRCGLLLKVITEKVKEFKIDAVIKHLSYTDAEAKEFADSIGLKTGTAKDVARLINMEIDKSRLSELIHGQANSHSCEYSAYNDCNWSYELDEYLRPFEKRAKDVGILMTPILIINGELKHQGSVPRVKEIDEWLTKLK
ncbi:MAG TPA: thioredoxin family protein [Bacteroidales bacterium]|jgi:hypothetical protein|nr:thioredoxin family protein [Bacteroidales bacterium]